MDIFWYRDGEKQGPATEVEIVSLLESGDLSEDVLAWHEGCDEWGPLKELPAMKELLGDNESGEQNSSQPELVVPYPYIRLIARLVDVGFHSLAYFLVLRILDVPFDAKYIPGTIDSVLYFCLSMAIVETIWLELFGTTFGKRLLGIGMLCSSDKPESETITVWRTMKRSLAVVLLGWGCFSPLWIWFTGFFSGLWIRQFGYTPWDRISGMTSVYVQEMSGRKLVRALLIFALCMYGVYELIAPWWPEIRGMMEISEKN